MAKKFALLAALALVLVIGPVLIASAGSFSGKWISASEMNSDTVKKVFSDNDWTTADSGDNIKVTTPEGRVFLVEWDTDKSLIAYVAYYNFQAGVTNKQKMELVNRINDEVVFCKAMVDKDGDLRFEYYIRYETGISDRQLLDDAKFFIMTTRFAVDKKDPDNLLK